MAVFTDKDFEKNVAESFPKLVKLSSKLSFLTKDEIELTFPSKIFTSFSNHLGALLDSVPDPPTLFLPDFPSSVLTCLVNLLVKGETKGVTKDKMKDLVSLATVLGIGLANLVKVAPKEKKEKIKKVKQATKEKSLVLETPVKNSTKQNKDEENENNVPNKDTEDKDNNQVNYAQKLQEELSNIFFRGKESVEPPAPTITGKSEDGNAEVTPMEQVEKEAEASTENAPAINASEDITLNDRTCGICKKTNPSLSLLGYHYCKHFLDTLKSSQFSNLYTDKKCVQCGQIFYDKSTLLSHIGVRHELINQILETSGLAIIPFWKTKRKEVKREINTEDLSAPSGQQMPVVGKVNPIKREPTESTREYESNVCQVCNENLPSKARLAQHMCSHFHSEIKALTQIHNQLKCIECDTTYPTDYALIIHLGLKHQQINSILRSKGLNQIALKDVESKPTSGIGASTENNLSSSEMISKLKSKLIKGLEHDSSWTTLIETPSSTLMETSSSTLMDTSSSSLIDKSSSTSMETNSSTDETTFQSESDISESTIIAGLDKSSSSDIDSSLSSETFSSFKPSINSTPAVGSWSSRSPPTGSNKNDPQSEAKQKGRKEKPMYPCEICQKLCNFPSFLGNHYCDEHFKEELKEDMATHFDGKQCVICKKDVTREQARHIGMKHGKINEYLAKKGLKPVKIKFYKYNNPSLKLAELKKQCEIVASQTPVQDKPCPSPVLDSSPFGKNMFVNETITETSESIEDIQNEIDIGNKSEIETKEETDFETSTFQSFQTDRSLDNSLLTPKILETFSLQENNIDIDGKYLVG